MRKATWKLRMQGWIIGLALKPIVTVAVAFGYYLLVFRGGRFICRFLPADIAECLLRSRGRNDTASPADLP